MIIISNKQISSYQRQCQDPQESRESLAEDCEAMKETEVKKA